MKERVDVERNVKLGEVQLVHIVLKVSRARCGSRRRCGSLLGGYLLLLFVIRARRNIAVGSIAANTSYGIVSILSTVVARGTWAARAIEATDQPAVPK